MNSPILTRLAEANRPEQFVLLEHATKRLTTSDAVTHLLVRGSLARGTADRLSDVDFVVGVEDSLFEEFVSVLDALVTTDLGGVLPGWCDTIVGDMGGLGYVYLIGWAGRLQQLDVYLAPASCIGRVREQTVCQPIFTRDPAAVYQPVPGTVRFTANMIGKPRSCQDLLVEALVIGYLIRKRISRGQEFIAYSEVFLFNTAVKNLIKTALAPLSTFYGWYQLNEEIGTTPIGRQCLNHLVALISASAIPTVAWLIEGLDHVLTVADMVAPETVDNLKQAIDAYRYYLELP
ncbi:nucleotidyltransferase domain-containing protein [Nocardia sp. alder85J]|uniref:nucleotidyltransferase domain-containing protein n=1 Tax=Nocardia sp. alder85J TaxID=2862949 RepID=UPI001CD570E1|nr:nucleotidyltransferase domain-containing protein [Nocardia sp. alder85J]MCX4094317.1 nucleotidyltransferase domain-containing protein [Nocardia sp. alder85J]